LFKMFVDSLIKHSNSLPVLQISSNNSCFEILTLPEFGCHLFVFWKVGMQNKK
jgi:hypothetical protein